VIVDALGNPLALSLTGGQVHDITQAEALLALVEPEALLADKGYDADHFATRYEKTARNFLAGLHLVCALVWLK
jgi:transposase